MKRIIMLLALSFAVGWMLCGCAHGQVKPTSEVVQLTWTAPAATGGWQGCGAGQPACTYIISVAGAVSGACPQPNTTTPNYTSLNQASPATGLTYTDTTASGKDVCYIAQTVQNGAVSFPSNTAGPYLVPGTPQPPGLTGAQTTAAVMPLPTDSHAPVLTAKVVPAF